MSIQRPKKVLCNVPTKLAFCKNNDNNKKKKKKNSYLVVEKFVKKKFKVLGEQWIDNRQIDNLLRPVLLLFSTHEPIEPCCVLFQVHDVAHSELDLSDSRESENATCIEI